MNGSSRCLKLVHSAMCADADMYERVSGHPVFLVSSMMPQTFCTQAATRLSPLQVLLDRQLRENGEKEETAV